MKAVLPLFIMIDAMGWEILRHDPFGKSFAPNRKRLESVFGYSSACVPSILSGRWPVEHRNWCYFVYNPKNSPFAHLRWLRWLPATVTSRRIFRRYLTKLVKVQLNFRGYFDLYNIPFKFIHLYDFTEKKSPLQPGGMNRGPNIFDFLTERKIPYFVTNTAKSEEQNRDDLIAAIESERVDFAFQYWAGLDGLLHIVGNQSPQVPAKLRLYEQWIDRILVAANKHYSEVHLYIFSDHGMANCDVLVDLKAKIDALRLQMGRDYVVVYDSTMARFWFFNDNARRLVAEALGKVPEGRILADEELRRFNAFFEDRYFGELIFLMKEGVLIVPSHMGERPIRAMHGYHPHDPQSYSTLCTNQPSIPEDITHIPHICRLMEKTALLARERNQMTARPSNEVAVAA